MTETIIKRLGAESLGTALLLAAVVGSGIMAERLAGGNMAVALLEHFKLNNYRHQPVVIQYNSLGSRDQFVVSAERIYYKSQPPLS